MDTIANVTLNGYQLGSVDNQFIRYRFLVKNLLKTQQNVIQISFTSAPVYARDYFLRKEYPIPPGNWIKFSMLSLISIVFNLHFIHLNLNMANVIQILHFNHNSIQMVKHLSTLLLWFQKNDNQTMVSKWSWLSDSISIKYNNSYWRWNEQQTSSHWISNYWLNGQLLIRDNFLLLGHLKKTKLMNDPKIFLQKIDGLFQHDGSHVYDIQLITVKIVHHSYG